MKFPINDLLRDNIKKMQKYASARDEFTGKASVYLDANENTIGSPAGSTLNRYPDPLQKVLRRRIAEYKNLSSEEEVFLGNGSDEAIDLLIRAFCEPRIDKMMIMSPTYGMYGVCAAVNDVEVLDVPLKADYSIDKEKVIQTAKEKKPKLIFICSPNNPSANVFPIADIEDILINSGSMVIIDEAYIDFASVQSWVGRINDYPNLVILQTFSKAWGMAGVRMGMAFSNPECIAVLNKIKYPYNINDVTSKIVFEALEHPEFKDEMVEKIKSERDQLMRALARDPLVREVFPSEANFFLVRFDNADAVYEYLAERGIIVRNRARQMHCGGCLRITVGTAEENRILLDALTQYSEGMRK